MGLYRAQDARILTSIHHCPFKAELEEREDKPTENWRKNNYLKPLCKKFTKQERKTSKDEVLPQEK